ncbi:MAG: hypothetical protein RLZZ568_2378, partial [Cyanobacteriota bacterium]
MTLFGFPPMLLPISRPWLSAVLLLSSWACLG